VTLSTVAFVESFDGYDVLVGNRQLRVAVIELRADKVGTQQLKAVAGEICTIFMGTCTTLTTTV
jgi:hypothetical protein